MAQKKKEERSQNILARSLLKLYRKEKKKKVEISYETSASTKDLFREAAEREVEKALEAKKKSLGFDRSFSAIGNGGYSSLLLSGEDAYDGQKLVTALYQTGISVEEALRRINLNFVKQEKQEEEKTINATEKRQLLF